MAKPIKFTSELGELSWVFIDGEGKDNYNEDGKEFAATVSLKGEAMTRTIEQFKEFWEANKPDGYTEFWENHKPSDVDTKKGTIFPDGGPVSTGYTGGDDEGEDAQINLSFKTGVAFPNGKSKVIKVYNSRGSQVALNDKKIGNGSQGCILGSMGIWCRGKKGQRGWEAGITLFLDGVQIVKFVEYSDTPDMQEYDEGFTGEEPEGLEADTSTTEKVVENKAAGKPRL